MNDSQKQLLQILSSCLYEEQGVEIDIADWNALIKEALNQGTFSLIFPAIKEQLKKSVEPYFFEKYTSVFTQYIAYNINNLYYHKLIHTLFCDNSIEYVFLKGQVSSSFYPVPYLRKAGDIDILIDKNSLTHADQILRESGFQSIPDAGHRYHITYRYNGFLFELHWEPGGIPDNKAGKRCRQYLKDIFEKKHLVNGLQMPDAFHHGIIILLHTAHHMLNTGLGLRHLCDWAVYVNKIDVSQFEEQLKNMGLWRFAQLLTQVSIRYLGCPMQQWALVDLDESVLESIIEDFCSSGEFGNKDPERINEAKIMTTTAQGTVGNNPLIQFFRMLTEKAGYAIPISKKVPILVPFGWIYVSIRHSRRIKKGNRPHIHIRKMIKGARQRRDIYRHFELFK